MGIVFKNTEGRAIKTWVGMEYLKGGLPMAGDIVVLHWGDYLEEAESYIVKRRIYDGCSLDTVVCIVEPIDKEKITK